MIKFFRRIRHNLLTENKFSKYLLYAIGEIILVVIGILLALQINDWNQQKRDRAEEQNILNNLQAEFTINKTDLEHFKQQYLAMGNSCKRLIELSGEPSSVLQQINIDSLISKSIDYWDYRPSENVLSDLFSSGKLKLISSNKLRNLLFKWSGELKQKEEAFQTIDLTGQEQLIPYLTINASMKNIDAYGLSEWKNPSKLKNNSLEMFQDIEFENHLSNHVWAIYNYINSLDKIEFIIDQIIEETKM